MTMFTGCWSIYIWSQVHHNYSFCWSFDPNHYIPLASSNIQLFDGHNGSAAAIYSKENLLSNILAAIPSDLNRDEWIAALPRSLVAGFVKTDKEFQVKAQTSGTTITFVIIEGWVISVASVGDSRCIVEPAEGGVYYLSADHRLECSEDERLRITSSGGEVGRLNTSGGAELEVKFLFSCYN
ncbi:hypothetical protein ACLB2K_058721 [Fragaria x ananassa]